MNTEPTLAALLHRLENAKAAEHAATQARLDAENAVLAAAGPLPTEGTTRVRDGLYVAVIQTSIRRSVDAAKLAEIAPAIPEAIGKRLIRWKPELDLRELRFIESNEPDIYRVVAQAIEAKPAKPALRVERAQAEAA